MAATAAGEVGEQPAGFGRADAFQKLHGAHRVSKRRRKGDRNRATGLIGWRAGRLQGMSSRGYAQ